MPSALETLASRARRRFLLAYLSREAAWRTMVLLLIVTALLALGCSSWLAAFAAIALLLDWALRWSAPGTLGSAVEVDRQLSLKELISTGLLAQNPTGLAAAARQQAETAARQIHPHSLDPGRWGLRYWAACLLLIGIIVAVPGTQAGRRPDVSAALSGGQPPAAQTASPAASQITNLSSDRRRPIGEASSDFASVIGQDDRSAGVRPADRETRADSDSRGAGTGLATGGAAPPSDAGDQRMSAPVPPGQGSSVAGAGAGRASPEAGRASGTGVLTNSPSGNQDSTQGSPLASGRSPRDLRNLPAGYRALVKDYFAR